MYTLSCWHYACFCSEVFQKAPLLVVVVVVVVVVAVVVVVMVMMVLVVLRGNVD